MGGIHDVITHARFGDDHLRGSWVVWGSKFSISHWLRWSSLQLSHYRVSVIQPESWYSFYRPTDGRRPSRPKWLATYSDDLPVRNVTHPWSNRAQCRLTTLNKADVLTTTLRHHKYMYTVFDGHEGYESQITLIYWPIIRIQYNNHRFLCYLNAVILSIWNVIL